MQKNYHTDNKTFMVYKEWEEYLKMLMTRKRDAYSEPCSPLPEEARKQISAALLQCFSR